MSIEEFWNQAFLAALVRLPAPEAKKEADVATKLCIENWESNRNRFTGQMPIRWKDSDITETRTDS